MLTARRLASFQAAQQAFGQRLALGGFKRGGHCGGNAVIGQDVADGDHVAAMRGIERWLDLRPMEMRGPPLRVHGGKLAPAMVRGRGREGGDRLLRSTAGGEQLDPPGPKPRVGTMLRQDRADSRTGKGHTAPHRDR